MPNDERKLRFVLSAGRTGTVFLTRALRTRYPHAYCAHEPSPARLELMLANCRNDWGIGGTVLNRLFHAARRRRIGELSCDEPYIEINPMLCPLTDLLPQLRGELCIVHMVRDPRTWTPSILSFKASGIRRHLIDFVPWSTPSPSPRPRGWKQLSHEARTLHRWRFCNEQIDRLASACRQFTVVRFEDLFSDETHVQQAELARLLSTLELEGADNLNWFNTTKPVNASPASVPRNQPEESLVKQICGPLLKQWNYE